jgi:Domain of unknown function (DU1801)
MAELKTQRTDASVDDFLARVDNPVRREDAQAVCALMTEVTGEQPAMWGTNIVGFGSYEYRYGSGQRGVWPAVGFSPRKQSLTVYVSEGLDGHAELLSRLGRHSTGKVCLYLPRLSDVDLDVLRELVRQGFDQINGRVITPGLG